MKKSEKTDKAYELAKALVAEGMSIEKACNEAGIYSSQFYARRKKEQETKSPGEQAVTLTVHRDTSKAPVGRPKRGSQEKQKGIGDLVIITTKANFRDVWETIR